MPYGTFAQRVYLGPIRKGKERTGLKNQLYKKGKTLQVENKDSECNKNSKSVTETPEIQKNLCFVQGKILDYVYFLLLE